MGCRIGEEYIYEGVLCDCGIEAVVVAVVRYQSAYGVRSSYTIMPLCQEHSEEYMIQEWHKETAFLPIEQVLQMAVTPVSDAERKVYMRSCYNMRQATILNWIQEQPEPPEARELAEQFGGNADTLRMVMNRWIQRGYVQREARMRQGTGVKVTGYKVKGYPSG